jgi:hypothetical protein
VAHAHKSYSSEKLLILADRSALIWSLDDPCCGVKGFDDILRALEFPALGLLTSIE